MKQVFKKYNWLFIWIAAAILIGTGITVGLLSAIVLLITGILLLIMAIFRFIPLLKTTVSKVMKLIFTGEALLNVGVGAYMIYLGTKENAVDMKALYGYLIGAILYLRGFVFFFGTAIKKEETDFTKFLAHIIFITVGTWSIATKGFTPKALGYVIMAIALLAATVLIVLGYKGFKNYRYEYAAKSSTKKAKTEKKENVFPENEKKKDPMIEETIIIPIKEEEKREEIPLQ